MYMNSKIAEEVILNIDKVSDLEISIYNHQGILIAAKNSAGIGTFDENALKALLSKSKVIVNNEASEANKVSYIKLLMPVTFNVKIVGVVGIFGSIEKIISSENILRTVVELTFKGFRGPNRIQQNNNKGLIMSIIKPHEYDHDVRNELLRSLDSKAEWVVTVFELFKKDDGKDLTSSQLQQVLLSFNSSKSVDLIEMVSPRELVMLKKVDVGPRGWDKQAIMKKIEGYCERLLRYSFLDFFISCGNHYEGISRLEISYQSAIHTLAIGKQLFPEQKIYSYNKMPLEVLLLSTRKDWASEHLEKSYYNLISNDKNGSLQKTLESFFGSNLSVEKAAKDLHVHRNTLRYRLGKIRDYTGMDVNNIDNMIVLYTAHKLHHISRISID